MTRGSPQAAHRARKAIEGKKTIVTLIFVLNDSKSKNANKNDGYYKADLWKPRKFLRTYGFPPHSVHENGGYEINSCVHRYFSGATEDAINAAREAFHAHLAATQKAQQSQELTDEELSQIDERELDAEFAGQHTNLS